MMPLRLRHFGFHISSIAAIAIIAPCRRPFRQMSSPCRRLMPLRFRRHFIFAAFRMPRCSFFFQMAAFIR
jgi:hypothetical protein